MDELFSFIRVCQSSGCSNASLFFGIFLGVLMVDAMTGNPGTSWSEGEYDGRSPVSGTGHPISI